MDKPNNWKKDKVEFIFRPKARLIRALGQELISNENVALIELVKNSFDADATKVIIRFVAPLVMGKGTIEVIDNGSGMSLDIIQNVWMEPATNEKKGKRRSEVFKRRILGEKGIGRFACARLSREMELITKKEKEEFENYIIFDWDQFENENQYLDQITVLAEQRLPKEICKSGTVNKLDWDRDLSSRKESWNHGTILRMNNLRKDWTEDDFINLQRDLSRLVSPFEKFSDFRVTLDLPSEYKNYSNEITFPEIIKYPHYSIRGKIDKDGIYDIKLRVYATGFSKELSGMFLWGESKNRSGSDFDILMLSEQQASDLVKRLSKEDLMSRKIQTGSFEFELRIWDRDDLGNIRQVTSSLMQDVRRDLDAIAGINIYRDGFRVLPYGEPDDDWLRLNIRRIQKPTVHLSNNQIVGFVSITAENNPNLQDQTNREGLDENQAYDDLIKIMLHIINQMEIVRYPFRKREPSKSFQKTNQGLFSALNLQILDTQIKTKYPNDKETRKLIIESQKEINKQVVEIQAVLSRYQRLATLGTLIDVVLHDGRHPLGSINNQAILGQEEIKVHLNRSKNQLLNSLLKRFITIEQQGSFIDNTFNKIEPFSGRKRGKPENLYLEHIIQKTFEVFDYDIKKNGINVTLPDSLTLVRVDQSEIQQILINLLQNSLYWLQYVGKNNREIVVNIRRLSEEKTEIIFADSGPGILPENKEQIFDPYFSTKPNGIGLGLAIAGEIISDIYNGTFELIDSNILPGAIFRIELNKRRG